jgi:hypothetical protein
MPTKPASRKSTIATKAKAGLGTFAANGKPDEVHKCAGECGKRLPVRSFPTTKAADVRVAECRVCRDKRTKAAK